MSGIQAIRSYLCLPFVVVNAVFLFGYALSADFSIGAMAVAREPVSLHGSNYLAAFLKVILAGDLILQQRLLMGLILALIICILSFRFRFLDLGGSLLALLLGTIIFGLGKWPFSLPMLCFFLLSSALSKISENRRREVTNLFQKSSRRDTGQVLANGGVAAALVVVWYFSGNSLWYFPFLGAVTAVTADTWATEIGVLLGRRPRSIVTWQPVPPGTSGGITLAGIIGAVAGASTIVAAAWLVRLDVPFGAAEMLLLIAGGVLAHLVDSVMGATIQAQHLCPACGKKTERLQHCDGLATRFHTGWPWVNNDVVNGLCALSGALIGVVAFWLAEVSI
jgi:uncharacterized protein (TIGR00297 family)